MSSGRRSQAGGDPNVTILEALLKADGAYVSGQELARRLNISRVGVWSRMEKLKEEAGAGIEALRNRGYRLREEPDSLSGPWVRAHLACLGAQLPLIFFPRIDSTSTEADRQITAGREMPFAVVAAEQTAGRGRLGRVWHSPDEGNVYLTVAFRPDSAPDVLAPSTLWLGVRLAEFLNSEYGIAVGIKWPNDLWAGGRKLAGVLTEARVETDRTREILFGIGLNANARPGRWPRALQSVATSLRVVYGKPVLLNRLAAGLIQTAARAFGEFRSGQALEELAGRFAAVDALLGVEVQASGKGGSRLTGIAEGIEPTGELRIRDAEGNLHHVRAGDVSIGSARVAAGPQDPDGTS